MNAKQTGFSDTDLKRLKEDLEIATPMSQVGALNALYRIRAMLARMEALELIREYAGAPTHERWLKAEEAYLRAAGKEGKCTIKS